MNGETLPLNETQVIFIVTDQLDAHVGVFRTCRDDAWFTSRANPHEIPIRHRYTVRHLVATFVPILCDDTWASHACGPPLDVSFHHHTIAEDHPGSTREGQSFGPAQEIACFVMTETRITHYGANGRYRGICCCVLVSDCDPSRCGVLQETDFAVFRITGGSPASSSRIRPASPLSDELETYFRLGSIRASEAFAMLATN